MTEQAYTMTKTDGKLIEKVLSDDNVQYLHMVLPKGEALPEHITNANVYMAVLRGTLSLKLNGRETYDYADGSLLKIPMGARMNARNLSESVLELTVVKAPSPEKN